MNRQAARKLVIVLGMHRSGTSAITRGLATLGVELGDNLLPPAQENNETGFWEDKDVYDFNERLLSKLGRHWDSASLIDDTAITSEVCAPEREEAANLLQKKLTRYPSFGIKDPRICILLPFWKMVFQAIDIEPRYIICVRNPEGVIRSLTKRDNFSREKSLALWLTHTLAAIYHTANEQRIFVDYELMLEAPERELGRMAECIGAQVPAPEHPAMLEYTRNFLSKNLNHSTAREPDSAPQGDSDAWAANVYLECKQQAINPNASCATLYSAFDALKKMAFALKQFERLDASQNALALAQGELVKTREERDRFIRELHSAEADIRGLKQAIDGILTSTSWRLSAPIRFLGLLAAGRTRDALQQINKSSQRDDKL